MRCPRCDATLVTFVIESADQSAVVCESCGFAGVPTSHHPDELDIESWEQAFARLDQMQWSPEQSCETGRTAAVSLPATSERSDLDFDELAASVPVVASVRNDQSSSEKPTDERSDDGSRK